MYPSEHLAHQTDRKKANLTIDAHFTSHWVHLWMDSRAHLMVHRDRKNAYT